MRICSLGPLAKTLPVTALSLVLAACGTNSQSNNICGGCAFLYATTNASQILTFKVDSSGALGTSASTRSAANSPDIAAANGGPVYLADTNSNAIDGFVVNAGDGGLTSMTGSPFSLGGAAGNPAGLLIWGTSLYAGDTNGTVSAFNIAADGTLTAVPGSPYAAGTAPLNLISTFTNSGSVFVLYAADFAGGGIWGFTAGSNGALMPVPGSPFATPPNSAPTAMAAGGDLISGPILYVALSGLDQVAAFSIGASGALTPLPGSPFAAGGGPVSLLAYVNFLYAMNGLDHTISVYSMDQNTGSLTEILGSPFPAGTASGALITDLGGVLYAPDAQSNSILAFSVDPSTGSLSPLSGSPFPASAGPVALTAIRFPVSDPP
jgi:6-phosphogluconolactonase